MESHCRGLQQQYQLAEEARASEKRDSAARLNAKNAEIERLTAENKALKASTTRDTLVAKDLAIANLRHEKVASDAKMAKLEAVKDKHDAQRKADAARIVELTKEVIQAKKESSQAHKDRKAMACHLTTLNDKLTGIYAPDEEDIRDSKGASDLQKEYEDLRAKLAKSEDEKKALAEDLKIARGTPASRKEGKDKSAENAQLKARVNELEIERDGIVEEARATLGQQQAVLKSYEEEAKAYAQQRDKEASKLKQDCQAEMARQIADRDRHYQIDLTAKLAEKETSIRQSFAAQGVQQPPQNSAEIDRLRKGYDHQKRLHEQLYEQHEIAKKEVVRLNKEVTRAQTKIRELEKEVEELENDNQLLEFDKAEAQDQLKQADRELVKKEKELIMKEKGCAKAVQGQQGTMDSLEDRLRAAESGENGELKKTKETLTSTMRQLSVANEEVRELTRQVEELERFKAEIGGDKTEGKRMRGAVG